ncbi:MAG: hypothetical protein U9N49_06495 [Campylobacterota bacterium]|nr:hypothetical protein [Campylobacterota bacterium]
MSFINKLNQLLQEPLVDTLATVYKKFKSSKSFYSVFYVVLVFTLHQAIAYQFGNIISNWFSSQGDYWFYTLMAFVFEHGSWELVVLGIFIMLLLAYVKIIEESTKRDTAPTQISIDGDNKSPIVVGKNNIVLQNSTLIIQKFPKSIVLILVSVTMILLPITIDKIDYRNNGIHFIINFKSINSTLSLTNEYKIKSKHDIRDIYNLDNIPNSQYKVMIDKLEGAKYTLSNSQEIIALIYDKKLYQGGKFNFEKFIKDSLPISDKKRVIDTHSRVMYDLTTLDNKRYLILYETKQNHIYQLIMPLKANQNVDDSKDLLKSFKIK